eukprot:CAMPEP_0113577746 /NCGR_PEP_ID=MMETSP0015_2-20120614/29059_1 /TAXON_ID=2838 /ORGANISM="Odontella" /LENGTH=48 /DNA_ID=CAMNT_0000481399 /DNA_START=30 /DNA_END=172 /DNA_ORIENTATION=+ /assembly_acc=CAM_ASM_000160
MQKYGATSKEARVARDVVEEMDSSDASPARRKTSLSLDIPHARDLSSP